MSVHPLPASNAVAMHIRFENGVPVIEVPETLAFDALREWIRNALPEQLESIGGRTSRLDIGQRTIKLFDLRRLIHLLRDEFSVEVTGLYVRPAAILQYAERELKLKLFPNDAPVELAVPELPVTEQDIPEVLDEPTEEFVDVGKVEQDALASLTLPNDLTLGDLDDETEVHDPTPPAAPVIVPKAEASEPIVTPVLDPNDLEELACEAPRRNSPDAGSRTLTVHRTLRSGSVVRYDGDIIVFGDVNPGANVIATGNVVILGALKGMAHAGATGDESSSILAFNFRPTQVRIARKIAIPPKPEKSGPELVVVKSDEIVIEPYKGRFR